MKISEHSIISNEWIENKKKYLLENRNKCQVYSDEFIYWQRIFEFLTEIKNELISPMNLCEKIWEASDDFVDALWSDEINLPPNKQTFLNSDIQID